MPHTPKQKKTQPRKSSAYCGCEWLDVPYDLQLKRKNEYMRELFTDVLADQGTSCEETLQDIVAMDTHGKEAPMHFRYKIATPFARAETSVIGQRKSRAKDRTQRGKDACALRKKAAKTSGIACGFYEPGTHHIVPCTDCPSEATGAREILNGIAEKAALLGIEAYDEDSCTGVLRHAILRISKSSGEIMLVLVTRVRNFPQKKALVRDILRAFPQITTVVQNVNARNTNAMLGSYNVTLFGPGKIRDTLLDCTFEIGPCSFFQTNPEQTETLYQVAIDDVRTCLEKRSKEARKPRKRKPARAKAPHTAEMLRIMDSYCGCGTIGICLASQLKNTVVLGIDQVEDSIERAKRNRKINHLGSRCVYSLDDATHFMQDFVYAANAEAEPHSSAESSEDTRGCTPRFDAIIMDPPRAGSTPEFIAGACALAPRCIVYISCNPRTQARDLAEFWRRGYKVKRITPVDMFPHTPHVETVVLMSRVEGK